MNDIIKIKQEDDMSNLPAITSADVVAYMTPEEKIKEASRQAKLLKSVVDQGKLARKFGGEKEHLAFEAWQTLAEWNGLAPITEWCNPIVEDGKIMGFEARVNVLDINTGNVVGSAINRCTRHEPNWKNKPDYALESMAQTRCGGKALRSRLSHIVVLAGYSATPAEEMEGINERPETKTAPLADPAQQQRQGSTSRPATDKQMAAITKMATAKFKDAADTFKIFVLKESKRVEWDMTLASDCISKFDDWSALFIDSQTKAA
jgi:hypothetical protein